MTPDLLCGPTLSLCWIVIAVLDNIDGPIARKSNTSSLLGMWLDHNLLDPAGAWLGLLAARYKLDIFLSRKEA